MKRVILSVMVLAASIVARADGCDAVVSVAPSAVFVPHFSAPVAVSVAPSALVTPLAVQVDAFAAPVAVSNVQVLAAPFAVRSCVAPRVRVFQRQARPRVTVRVR